MLPKLFATGIKNGQTDGRTENMNEWPSKHSNEPTNKWRTSEYGRRAKRTINLTNEREKDYTNERSMARECEAHRPHAPLTMGYRYLFSSIAPV